MSRQLFATVVAGKDLQQARAGGVEPEQLKFLHISRADATMTQLARDLELRFARVYPNLGSLAVRGLQNQAFFDLDPGYRVRELFPTDGSPLYVIVDELPSTQSGNPPAYSTAVKRRAEHFDVSDVSVDASGLVAYTPQRNSGSQSGKHAQVSVNGSASPAPQQLSRKKIKEARALAREQAAREQAAQAATAASVPTAPAPAATESADKSTSAAVPPAATPSKSAETSADKPADTPVDKPADKPAEAGASDATLQQPAPTPKKRGRPKKIVEPAEPVPTVEAAAAESRPVDGLPAGPGESEVPVKRKPGRPKKVQPTPNGSTSLADGETAPEQPVKRRPGRPKKNPVPAEDAPASTESGAAAGLDSPAPKKRGRPRKYAGPDEPAAETSTSPADASAPAEAGDQPAKNTQGASSQTTEPAPKAVSSPKSGLSNPAAVSGDAGSYTAVQLAAYPGSFQPGAVLKRGVEPVVQPVSALEELADAAGAAAPELVAAPSTLAAASPPSEQLATPSAENAVAPASPSKSTGRATVKAAAKRAVKSASASEPSSEPLEAAASKTLALSQPAPAGRGADASDSDTSDDDQGSDSDEGAARRKRSLVARPRSSPAVAKVAAVPSPVRPIKRLRAARGTLVSASQPAPSTDEPDAEPAGETRRTSTLGLKGLHNLMEVPSVQDRISSSQPARPKPAADDAEAFSDDPDSESGDSSSSSSDSDAPDAPRKARGRVSGALSFLGVGR